jgi:uncharacterized protein with HEPN domain
VAEADYLIGRSSGLSLEAFESDATLRRAFAHSLEVIGEAAKKLPSDFRSRHAHVEWRAMTGMRDRLIHAYFGIDYPLVWDVVVHEIPELRRQILEIIAER